MCEKMNERINDLPRMALPSPRSDERIPAIFNKQEDLSFGLSPIRSYQFTRSRQNVSDQCKELGNSSTADHLGTYRY